MATLLPTSARADQSPARIPGAVECPAIMPLSAVQEGMTGQGLTVVRGATPQPFNVEVLGILDDGIGAGRDMIVIEASDVTDGHVIDQGGGIWAGMSGSPVYVDGQLLGAVSYGFTASPSPIGGLTPAADMAKLLTPSDAKKQSASAQGRATVTLSPQMRQQIDARATQAAPTSLQRLPLPLAVSGLGSTRLARFQSEATAAGLPVIAHAGGGRAAPSATAPMARPEAGGNFAAALSYGDLTAAGMGTTTAVCGTQALAWGHPFTFGGPATYGANHGSSLAIVKDETFGAFKLGNITEPFGVVDQDRLAALHAKLGVTPTTTPISVRIRNLNPPRSRTGVTQVVDPQYLAGITPFAVLTNYDSTFDEIGDGRATSAWTIQGTRRGGKAFSVSRGNRWASRFDVAVDPAFDLGLAVDAIVNNEFEAVKVQQITFDSLVSTAYGQLSLADLAVSVNGGKFTKPSVLRVKPGAKLRLRATLRPYQSGSTSTALLNLTVPKNARGKSGSLSVTGGLSLAGGGGEEEEEGCLFTPSGCGSQAQSLDGVIKGLLSAPRNDDVVASLALESEEGAVSTTTAKNRQSSVVSGARSIAVVVQ
ncbi:MAG: SpoIVB peptidase S55 domain-containing protein [Actinomycetes bacterium]